MYLTFSLKVKANNSQESFITYVNIKNSTVYYRLKETSLKRSISIKGFESEPGDQIYIMLSFITLITNNLRFLNQRKYYLTITCKDA